MPWYAYVVIAVVIILLAVLLFFFPGMFDMAGDE